MKVHMWLCKAESIPGLCGVIIFLLSVVICRFMFDFAYKRTVIETMKHLDFKSSESRERIIK